jgi:hypothetical protein
MKKNDTKEFEEAKELFENPESLIEEVEEDSEEPKAMSDDEIVSFLDQEIAKGIGGEDNYDYNNISLAWDYYRGRLPGISKQAARDPNTSRFVSMDVMDTLEATVAEIMPTFMTSEIAFFEPEASEDEKTAKEESDLVNYVFFDENDGYNVLQTALRDALLNRNCSAKIWWDDRMEVQYETYENVDPISMMEILQPTAPDEEVEIIEQEIEGEVEGEEVGSIEMEEEGGVEVEGMPPEEMADPASMFVTYTIKIKRTRRVQKPLLECIAPENIIVTAGQESPTLYDTIFVAHENIETESSLIEQGFDPEVVRGLQDYNTSTTIEAQSRTRVPEENNYYSSDRSVRYIQVYECYVLLDVDGDGIAERRKIVYSQHEILSNDPWDGVSIVGGVVTPTPHTYLGVSLFERIRDIQDAKTPVLRSIINGTQLSSNPRIGVVTGEVNIDDLLTSRTGGTVRADSAQSIFEVPRAEVPQSSYTFIDLMDNLRKERGGGAVGTAAMAQKVQGDTAHAFERTMSSMELTNALLARTFAETFIKGIFLQLHQIIRENFTGELAARIGGKWIRSYPRDWKVRNNITISIGASNAERQRQVGVMEKVIELQGILADKGSLLVDPSRSYKAITTAITLSGIKNPETYFVDPESEEGQQKAQGQSQQEQEMKQKQEMMEQAMAKAQNDLATAELIKGQAALSNAQMKAENDRLKNEIDGLETALDDKNKDADREFKYDELRTNTALSVTELELQYNKDVSDPPKEETQE